MTEKRFTNIEHDYENAWIKCNDDGDFMIYAIYKELDESLPSLEDLLNGLSEENKELQERNNRQAKRLDDIYQLIEQKDWRALSDIMDDFKKAEEQLQSEWQTYCDD